MNKLHALLCLFILLSSSCKKSNLEPITNTEKQTYLVVDCESCKVEYGMPDQYNIYNVAGNSGKLYFKQEGDYNLKTYITALNKTQKIVLTVYNKADKKVYSDTTMQATTGMWETYVLVRTE